MYAIRSYYVKLLKGVEQSPVCTFITDIHGHIEYINPEFTKVTGYSENDVSGKTPGILKSGHQDNDVYKAMWFTIKSRITSYNVCYTKLLRNHRLQAFTEISIL